MPLVQIDNKKSLNAAARALLRAHISKPVSKGWRYLAKVAIETICKTYSACPSESAEALNQLMTPERLAQFPHDDLFELANAIPFLGPTGDEIVLRLFQAAFDNEPEPGHWQQFGSSVILPMRIQSSDQWNSIHYSLAEYYCRRTGNNAALMAEIACFAWNAVTRRRRGREGKNEVIASIDFRGVRCELRKDNSHIWGRQHANEENRILSHFQELLRQWAAKNDATRIDAVLDAFARRNQTSLLWSVLMDIGAEYPQSLGHKLEPLLLEPVCLYDHDYTYAAAGLLSALHKSGDPNRRERLERLILDLPAQIQTRRKISLEDQNTARWVRHVQNSLLAGLQEQDIASADARELWRERKAAGELDGITRPRQRGIVTWTDSDEELIEQRGVSLKDPANAEMFTLRKALKPFLESSASFSIADIERQWSLIGRSEKAVTRYRSAFPEMSQELWGYLVSVCLKLTEQAQWPKGSARWQTVRRILLRASRDPVPAIDPPDSKHDACSGWSWPSPRIDAAKGLQRLVAHVGEADSEVTAAIRALSHDGSAAVRFNLASALPLLALNAPKLMWEIVDSSIATESNFSVLDAIVHSLDWLWGQWSDDVAARLRAIGLRVRDQALVDHPIHETLAHSHLFQFLRTGRPESEKYIRELIVNCAEPQATKALLEQLHPCRAGGWMTIGDPEQSAPEMDAIRARTWSFLLNLLRMAQSKIQAGQQRWSELKKAGQIDTPEMKEIQSEVDRLARLVHSICSELYFGSGAFADKQNKDEEKLTVAQTRRYWLEAAPLLKILAAEPHPQTAYETVQTLSHLLPCSPEEIFLLAAESIRASSQAGFQFDSLAVTEVVKLVQRVLADHREIFQARDGSESAPLTALLEVLDIFVEAGWPEARALTHRLEEIYR